MKESGAQFFKTFNSFANLPDKKRDANRISSNINAAKLRCVNHPNKKAKYKCTSCHRVYCIHCCNKTEVNQQEVLLCVECDETLQIL